MSGSPKDNFDCDVAIVGGGLVGASLALALDGLGLRTILLEAVPPRAASQPSYDDRTLALNHTSCQILRGLGLWPDLQNEATPIREILVSERGRPGRVHLEANKFDLEAFGHVIEARSFGAAVLARLETLARVEMRCPVRVAGLQQDAHGVSLELDQEGQPGQLRARLVVAADGARSSVREALGLAAEHHDYRQVAIIANLTPEEPHRNRAYERFMPGGPLAILPHREQRCGSVWVLPAEEAEQWLQAPDDEYLDAIQQAFGLRLGRLGQLGQRASYPLHLVHARDTVSGRVVVIGNAAHAINPVSAQGFNLGLRDVAVLADLLASANLPGEGQAESLLQEFSRLRQPDTEATVRYTDSLARVFTNPSLLARHFRTLGLAAHELLPPLKRRLALGAMGYRGVLPSLARGLPPGSTNAARQAESA